MFEDLNYEELKRRANSPLAVYGDRRDVWRRSAAASADLSIANSKHWNLAIRGRTLQLAIQQCFWLTGGPSYWPVTVLTTVK